MIFVTVGTHEQQFDRLIKKIDEMKICGKINEEVFIQTGYSNYEPKVCKYKSMIGFDEMNELAKQSRIVITHGGPGSIMLPFKYNKVPIVVPRQSKYREHVDNHQIIFSRFLNQKNKIIQIEDIDEIEEYIQNYDKYIKNKLVGNDKNNTKIFNMKLNKIIMGLV
ncbi:multidrug MFS transporter [Paraclostridium bifermentans]|uniref:glycosyltransferase n=1 Tax=Paraclostridium bifermentans TaxID=1490 RepID=UPI001F475A45|nr:glycosyltransferase [Paraclostridium bifermentans]MCE9675722.1 multidrug MFS transporter [Paraclostridium bifermentans]MCR1876254.1 multidrug MFS transporter [Paraclostridium bifermentans]